MSIGIFEYDVVGTIEWDQSIFIFHILLGHQPVQFIEEVQQLGAQFIEKLHGEG